MPAKSASFLASLLIAVSVTAGPEAHADALATMPPLWSRAVRGRMQQSRAGFRRARAGRIGAGLIGKAFPTAAARGTSRACCRSRPTCSICRWPFRTIPSCTANFAGDAVDTVTLVCYPTLGRQCTSRIMYLPTGKTIPHMQRLGELPIWPDAATRFPVLLFSHGLTGSPISNDYIEAINISRVAAMWSSRLPRRPAYRRRQYQQLQRYPLRARGTSGDFVALQSVRPLALHAVLDASRSGRNLARSHRRRTDRSVRGEHRRRIGDAALGRGR